MFATAFLASLLLGSAHAIPAASIKRTGEANSKTRWGGGGHGGGGHGGPSPWGPGHWDHGGNHGRGQTYDLPLELNPFGFVSTARVGTPETEIVIFVDWTWIGQVVTTPRCYGVYDPGACFDANQITWDPRHSTTFQNLSTKYDARSWKPNHFFFEDPLDVDYGSDKLQVGPVISDTVLQLTDVNFDQAKYGFAFPFTGVFGLSPIFDGDDKDYQSPFYQQWKKGDWKEGMTGFAFCYDDSKKPVCDGHDGIQTLGGVRRDLIKNNKIWWHDVELYPDVNELAFVYDPPLYNYWGIELESLKFDNENQKVEPTSEISGKGAIFDHASYGRGLPLTPNAYARLVVLTKATPSTVASPNNGGNAVFAVDCAAVASFPVAKYKFRGSSRVWTVKPEAYVETMEDGSCVLNVRALASGDKFIGNFGETFAKDKYIVLDFEKNRVGIADMNW